MNLLTSCFRATYRASSPFVLPHDFGGIVQSVVGRALRRVGCALTPCCEGPCAEPGTCAAGHLLAPPLSRRSAHQVLLGRTAPLPPLVPIVAAPRRYVVPTGGELDIGLRVLGPLGDDEATLIERAFEEVPRLDDAPDLDRVALTRLTRDARNAPVRLEPNGETPSGVWVDFVTPAWIEVNAAVDPRLSFQSLFRAIYRRLAVVTLCFGELDDSYEEAFEPLDRAAEHIVAVERHARTARWERRDRVHGTREQRLGIFGPTRFEGALAPFVPYLRIGELLHVGKLTGEGLGRMRCRFD